MTLDSFCFVCGEKLVQYDESAFTIDYICPNCKFIFHLRINVTMGNEIQYEPIELKPLREEVIPTLATFILGMSKILAKKTSTGKHRDNTKDNKPAGE